MRKARVTLVNLLFCVVLLAACGGGDEDTRLPTPLGEAEIAAAPTNALQIGIAQAGELSSETNVASWTLSLSDVRIIQVQLTRFTDTLNLNAQLIAPDGSLVNQFGTGTDVDFTSPPITLDQIGDYKVQVSGGGTSGQFSLMVVDGSTAATLAVSQPVASPTPTPTITPSLTATLIEPTATSTTMPTLTQTPTAEVVASATPAPTDSPDAASGRLDMNSTQSGSITQAGQTNRHTFFGTAEEVISAVVNLDPSNVGTLNPFLELQAPSGDIIEQGFDYSTSVPDALIRNITLPTTGVYTLYVKSEDDIGTGDYLISVSNGFTLRDVMRGDAPANQPVDQTLETYGARDIWTMELNAGDLISVSVEVRDPNSDFDVMTELVSPTGEVLGFDINSGAGNNAFLSEITIESDGTHRLHIAARNNATIGDYRIWWQRLDPETGLP